MLNMENTDRKDHCVVCGKETPYYFSTHIDYRVGYIEGVGQLCRICHSDARQENKSGNTVILDKSVIESTPNDYDLGEKVRKLYHEASNNR